MKEVPTHKESKDDREDPEAHRCLVLLHIVVDEASPRDSSVSSLVWPTPPSSGWSPLAEGAYPQTLCKLAPALRVEPKDLL